MSTNTSLGHLPPELVLNIAHQSHSRRTISRLMRTCRAFANLLHNELYRLDAQRRRGGAALVWAAEHGDEDLAQRALAHYTIFRKTKPLITAAENGHPRLVEMLLTLRSVDIEATNYDNYTALDRAVIKGHGPVVNLLLDAGANPSTGKTIGEVRQGDAYPLLFDAVSNGFRDVVRHLVYCDRLTPENRYHNGWTPLDFAIDTDNVSMIDCLLQFEIDRRSGLRSPFAIDEPYLALRLAISHDNARLLKLLALYHRLVAPIDPNGPNEERNRTIAYLPFKWNRVKALKALLRWPDVDFNVIDQKGLTPLTYALTRRLPGLALILLDREDLDVKLKYPFYVAIDRGYVEVARGLLATNRLDQTSLCEGLIRAITRNRRGTALLIPLLKSALMTDCSGEWTNCRLRLACLQNRACLGCHGPLGSMMVNLHF
ncbi:ankyrin repeat-containing domain protein [Aspergillus karnatakaensis]|uniref:ankyrin repeat-containing domain protein n=1 Tax=Aspergillus karnatakaensis TaxID=1810916 RepID=UPI003CCCC76C